MKIHAHQDLSVGDRCPLCTVGLLKAIEPTTVIKIHGEPPFAAVKHQQERLRCNLCDAIFKAPLPEGVAASFFDEEATSLLALLRYKLQLT